MRRSLLVLFLTLLPLASCDDGDIIAIEFEFDQELQRCLGGDFNNLDFVVYDIKVDPSESLTLLFPSNETNNLIFNPEVSPHIGSLDINGSSVRFNYRFYDGDPNGLICQEIPDSNVTIIEDYESTSGTVDYVTTFIDDDLDGIPTALEDENLDGDDNPYTNPTDTDGDGIPNYKDIDDDNDNVRTQDENPDPNSDEDLSDAQDTDGDGTPDYLDMDDDNDGVITRYEDANGNKNPKDDFQPGAIIPRYLDITAIEIFVIDDLIQNEFTRTTITEFTLTGIDIEILSADSLFFGTYTSTEEF